MFKDPSQRNNKFLVNAEDFQIFRIGSYDRKTGCILSQQPEHICNLHDLRVLALPSGLATPIQPTDSVTIAQAESMN